MVVIATLMERSGAKCELCESCNELEPYVVAPEEDAPVEAAILICADCRAQLVDEVELDANHWRCLNTSIWSEISAVKVVAYRVLNRLLAKEAWAQDLLDMLHIEDELLVWAKAGMSSSGQSPDGPRDSNGMLLASGDTVTLIKDLDVKGAGFTAKRGTTVKNISVSDDRDHIEGRVNGVRIVLVTRFLKKLV